MRNKCGVQQTVRTRLIERMFGEAGILNANDSVDFERQADNLVGECERVSSQLREHFTRHMRPAIQKCVFEPRQQNQWLRRRWNNNACKSVNHVLKLSVNWRLRRLPDLVECLHKVVEMQIADLRRALHSQGNFEVTPPFGNFVVVWQSMSAEDKDAHVASFVAYRPTPGGHQHNRDVIERRADCAGDEADRHQAWAAQTTQVRMCCSITQTTCAVIPPAFRERTLSDYSCISMLIYYFISYFYFFYF